MTSFFVTQDDYGFWFSSQEMPDGSLHLLTHSARLQDAAEDAARKAAVDGGVIYVEKKTKDLPTEGIADYTIPEPRRVKNVGV